MLALTREKCLSHLLEVPNLVQLYQNRDPIFVERTIEWLSTIEKTLSQLRHPFASYVAVERGKILAVADGYQETQVASNQQSKRKLKFATTLVVLCDVESELQNIVTEIDKQFQVWQEKMVQFLAIASSKQAIPLTVSAAKNEWLSEVWAMLKPLDNTQSMYNYLNFAMKPPDRLYILAALMENISCFEKQGI